MLDRIRESEDEHSRQAVCINSKTLTGERENAFDKTSDTEANPVPSSVSHDCVSCGKNLEPSSELIISDGSYARKKRDECGECGETHRGERLYAFNQNGGGFSQNEESVLQKRAILELSLIHI